MKYFKIIYDVRGRELRSMFGVRYYSDAEKAAASYHIIEDMLQAMYDHELILNFRVSMDITEEIQ